MSGTLTEATFTLHLAYDAQGWGVIEADYLAYRVQETFDEYFATGAVAVKVSPTAEHCPVCGQADNCGDCTHQPAGESDG